MATFFLIYLIYKAISFLEGNISLHIKKTTGKNLKITSAKYHPDSS